ncbi:MAG: TetR/AcrR family transcriptional regulator [Clostridia bacterium]|nr:TetR/AcrR family transcriptional regulator [Clostridia bacterium]
MPPKVKFTREQIASKAFDLVRNEGIAAFSARSLAERLGTSTAPIFTAFDSIEEVKLAVKEKAIELYGVYFNEGMSGKIPFKGAGLSYIKFAKEEPQLFKLLFMYYDINDTVHGYHPGDSVYSDKALTAVCSGYGLDEKKAMWLYNHLSVYTHGLAVMFANGNSMFTMDEASKMLTEVFNALTRKAEAL